jgi:hypothetical protein
MKPQLLKAITPNKMLFIKGKLIRTPLEYVIRSEAELNLLKASMICQSVKYSIKDYVAPAKEEKKVIEVVEEKLEEPKKKKLKTTLEKIANDIDE